MSGASLSLYDDPVLPAAPLAALWHSFPRAVRERYEPIQIVGEGGMGVVIEARDRKLGRRVAIKGARRPRQPGEPDRLSREARITARLTHPNILPVFDAWNDASGSPWCSLLLVRGQTPTLAHRLAAIGPATPFEHRPVAELLQMFLQVCRGVAHAHGERILHRDLKPENILLGPAGEALVADWGVAADITDLLSLAELVGTPGYAAPEQASSPPATDERSDVHALGVMLAEMLGAGPLWRPSRNRLPGELSAILRRARAAEPARRHASVSLLMRDIEVYLQGGIIEGVKYSPPERAMKWVRAHPLLSLALPLLALLAAVYVRGSQRTAAELAAKHLSLAQSHDAWAAREREAGQLEESRLSAALALWELAAAPPGSALASGAANTVLAGARPDTRLVWACQLDGPAEVVRFDRDGGRLSVATRAVSLWTVVRGARRATPAVWSRREVWGVAIHPDGVQVASGGGDRTLRLWNTCTGALLERKAHDEPFWALAYSPDGKLLATGGFDRKVRLWDTSTGECKLTLTGHTGQVWSVVFSPDGAQLASSDTEREVLLWSRAGHLLHRLAGHPGPVVGLAFSPDGRRLACGGQGEGLRLWDTATGADAGTLAKGVSDFISVTFDPAGRRLATGGLDHMVRIWDATTGRQLLALPGHTQLVSGLAFHPGGRLLATGSQDRTLRLWDVSDRPAPVPAAAAGTISALVLSPDGRTLATVAPDRVAVGPVDGPATTLATLSQVGPRTMDLSGPSPRLYTTVSGRSLVTALDGRPLFRLDGVGHDATVATGGGRVAARGDDGTLGIWDVSGHLQMRLPLSGTAGDALAFDASGRHLAASGAARRITIWDLERRNITAQLDGHEETVTCLAFSPDGRTLASGSEDRTVRLWDLATGQGRVISEHDQHVHCVAFSPEGHQVASGGMDGKIRLWDARTGSRFVLDAAGASVDALVFTPGGRLLSGSGPSPQSWDAAALADPATTVERELASSFFAYDDARGTIGPRLLSAGLPPAEGW